MPQNWSRFGGKVSWSSMALLTICTKSMIMERGWWRWRLNSQNKQVVIGSTLVYSSNHKQRRHEKAKASQNARVIKNLYQTLRWSDNFNDVFLYSVVFPPICCSCELEKDDLWPEDGTFAGVIHFVMLLGMTQPGFSFFTVPMELISVFHW